MPFTPFHMGFALAAKAAARRYFSIPVFAFTQVAIDAEVLVGFIFPGDLTNHAVLHTLGGGALVTVLAVLLVRPIIQPGARLWNHLTKARPGSLLHMAPRVGWPAAVVSALAGSASHVALDAATHSDIRPFAPLAGVNPLFGLISPTQAMLLCILLWIIGGGAILALTYRRRRAGGHASAVPTAESTTQDPDADQTR